MCDRNLLLIRYHLTFGRIFRFISFRWCSHIGTRQGFFRWCFLLMAITVLNVMRFGNATQIFSRWCSLLTPGMDVSFLHHRGKNWYLTFHIYLKLLQREHQMRLSPFFTIKLMSLTEMCSLFCFPEMVAVHRKQYDEALFLNWSLIQILPVMAHMVNNRNVCRLLDLFIDKSGNV